MDSLPVRRRVLPVTPHHAAPSAYLTLGPIPRSVESAPRQSPHDLSNAGFIRHSPPRSILFPTAIQH